MIALNIGNFPYIYDAWIASACMPSVTLRHLLEVYGDSFSCYEAFIRKEAGILSALSPRICRILESNCTEAFFVRMKSLMDKHSILVLHLSDSFYPASLMHINDPPVILFYQGNPDCLNHRILAMVGSRAASYAGQKATGKLAEDLSRHGVSVISGLACGIDASAHQGCLNGGSPTIAVTGCGLDRVYPSDNLSLRDSILKNGGLILSEYIPGEKPAGWHFPVRNRIIAGLCTALILMEAKIRSGSMTSVQHALEQGKDVFVYPGDPNSSYFEGNHQLLREGGLYFTNAEDILNDLHWLDNPSSVGQNSDCSAGRKASSPEGAAVLCALEQGMLSFEQLLNSTGMNPSVLMSTLTILQISGLIESLPGKYYQLKH